MVHVFKSTHLAGVQVQDVWDAIAAFEKYEAHMPDVISVEVDRLEADYWTSQWAVMLDGVEFTWEEKDFLSPPHHLSFELIDGDVAELSGAWSISETDGGCEVSLEMHFDLGIPSMSQTLDPLAIRALEKNIEGLLNGVASIVHGETPKPKPKPKVLRKSSRQTDRPLFIGAHSVEVGDVRALEQLEEINLNSELLGTLRERGLQNVACFPSRERAFLALKNVIENALAKSVHDAAEIEAIFFTTGCLTWRLVDDQTLLKSLGELGLGKCPIIGVNMGSCANTGTAFRVAQGMMSSEQLDVALLITLDWVDSDDRRLSAPDIGMNADAASACVLSRTEGAFRIIDSFNYNDAQLSDDDLPHTDPTMHLDLHIKGIATVLKETLTLHGLTHRDIQVALVPNLNQTLTQLVAAAVGMKRARVIAPNVANTAHVQTSDALLNLSTAMPVRDLTDGDYVLLVSSGPQAWSCSLLRFEPQGVSPAAA